MNNFKSIFSKLVEGPQASRRRESVAGSDEQPSSNIPPEGEGEDVQQNLNPGVQPPEENHSSPPLYSDFFYSIITGSKGADHQQTNQVGLKPANKDKMSLAECSTVVRSMDVGDHNFSKYEGSLKQSKSSHRIRSLEKDASITTNATSGIERLSQTSRKSACLSISTQRFCQDDEEPEAKHDPFIRTFLKIWNRIKGNHDSALEGPTVTIPKTTIIAYFSDKIRSKNWPSHQTAITYDRQESISFGKLHASSYIMGKVLVDVLEERAMWTNHVSNEDLIIALSVPNSHKLVVCIFGILKIGATYLPINDLCPGERIAKVMLNMRPVLYIYSRESDALHFLTANSITACVSFEEIWKKFELAEVSYQAEKQDPIIVMSDKLRLRSALFRNVVAFYSICHNGAVVPLKFSNTAVFNRLFFNWKAFPYEKQDISLLQSPIHEVNSITEIFAPLLQGITLIIVNSTDLEHPFLLSSKVQDYLVTRITISSAWLKAFLLSIKFSSTLMDWHKAFASVRIWYCLGEPIDKELAEQFFKHYLKRIKKKHKHFNALVNLLQVDENLGAISYKIITDFNILKSGIYSYVGRPIPNSIIYVVNEKFEIVPQGTSGEIFISSLQSMAVDMIGINGLNIRTGCFGIMTSSCSKSQELLLESREPFLMTLEGSVVDIREVGYILEKFSVFQEYHLLIYNAGEPNQKVVAFCVPRLDHKALTAFQQTELLEDINSRLKNMLHKMMVPDVVLLESIPRTIGGQIDDNVLRTIYGAERSRRIDLTNFRRLFATLKTHEAVRAASVFLPMITHMLGIPVEYCVGLEEFLSAENLLEVISMLSKLENKDKILSFQVEMDGKKEIYQVELITDFHKYEVIDLLSDVCLAKGTLESLVGIHRDIARQYLKNTWPLYTFKYFSFIAIGMKGKFGDKHRSVGAIINVDSEKYFHQISKFQSTNQFLSYRQQVIEHLNSGNLTVNRSKLLEILYVGSSGKFLNAEEKEKIDKVLIGQSFKVAKHCQYDAVIYPCFDDLHSVICIRDYGFK
ncbi:unnamed protein product, partial [Allacma fusca]